MNTIKKLSFIGAVLCVASLHPTIQAADSSRISFGCTNSIAVATTITANMGNALPLGDHANVGIEHHFTGTAAGTTDVITKLALSSADNPVAADWQTSPVLSVAFAQNGSSKAVGYTNVYVGAARWIKIVSIQNQDADAVLATNAVYLVIKKGL